MDGSLHAKHVNSAEASNSSIVTDANWIALESPELTSKPNLFPVRPSSEPVDTNVASKEQVQNFIQTVCNTPPEQLSSGCEADVTVSTVLSAHTQMSLDSKTGQIPLLSQPESFNFSTTEDQFKATVSSKTATQSSTPVQSSMKSAQLSGCTSFTTVHISQTEYRSSPDSGSEYVADLEMPIHECRPTSPESAVSLPIDSPISFDYHYRSDSLDSCALMAEIRASSPESVASGTDQVLLSPDSPLPDFRPLSPLPPVCEHETPVFTVYVEECRTSGGTGNEQYSSMHVSDTQFIPRTSYLMVFDETNRPISPGSMIEFRSVTPESNESLSSVSFHSESLDRETSPEKGSEYDHWSNADILIDMPSSPEATGSLNEYISLSLDSPVPSFTPEVFDFLGHVKEYLSSSSQSEISDVDPELSLEWLFEGRQSSPESVVSVNEWMVLSPDSPLPSFVQNVCQLAMPTKECRSVSPETDFSDREYDFVPPVVSPLESRPSSPESLASVHEHRPLSPDSPIPHCTSAVCELHTSVGGYISNSPESDLSDRDYRPISPIAVLSEDRPSSPELVSSVNVHRPFSSYSPVPAYRQTMSDYDISLIQKPPSLEMGLSDIVCSSFDPKVPQSALKTQSLESKISETDNSNEIISGSMLSHDSVTDSMILSSRQILKASEKSTENLPKQRSELDVNKQKTDVGYTVKPFISELTNQASCAMNITVVPCTRSSHQEVQDINITAVKQEFGENKVHLPKLSESVVPEHQALFAQPLTSTPIEQSLDSSPTAKYKLVFKHVLNNLMRNIYDPQYKGETFCPKPGVFEYSPSSPNVASSSAIAQGPLYSLPCPKELDSTLTEQYSPVSEPLTKAYKQYSLLVEHCFNSEAIKSEFESHPLSLEPVNEYKPMTPESLIFLEHLRTSSPESTASVDELRALSPDSPVPQYVCMYFEPDMSITGDRSLTPESAITEEEYDMTADQLTVTYCRPSSPQSIASGDRRPLSPDSPIPEFRTSFPESSLPISGYRSCSPDSLCSESIEYENVLGDLFTAEKRPESPDSFVSEVEDRPFSPDSISEYRPRSPESMTLLSDTRGFSPDSVSECRPSSPDSPTPQFSTLLFELVPVIGHRSSSLESLASDTDYDLNVLTDAPSSYRLSSPDSMTMADEFSLLSTDSPIPEFRSSFPETVLPVSGYRSCSSESVSSESTEYDGVLEDFVTAEQRPESPDSFVLDVEDRPLSPDSIPEYRPISPESMSSPSDTRGSSPDSVSEYRPLSPDSPIPHYSTLMLYEVVPVIRHRSSSLESLASDTDYDLGVFTDMAFCHRSSSPDSIASANESRPLSPDSPVPEFRISFTESSLPVSGYRPCSPESVCSESTKYECFLGDLFTVDQRPESPDSVSECRPLSPDSPIPQYSALLHEVAPFIGHRWSSLESLASDTDYKLNVVTDAASYQRPSSPDSMASVGESRPLSPDSPVPEFRSSFPDNAIPVSGYRSCSPDSVCSEPTEYESCFEECITLEERPESQDSFVSEVEDRPLSPDSIPEYRPMSPGSINFLSDIRGSSPDFVSRSSSLSPDSPIPQYSALLCELVPVIGHRSSSLESLASDTDYDLGDLGDFTDEAFCQRPSSPDSMASANKNRPLSPDSPVPEFRTAFPECSLPVSGYRPCSPESVCSESTKYECFLGDLFTVDQRPESPDSVSECRPLSPESPIPQYLALFCEVAPFIGQRWSSLESLASDTDYELNVTDEASYQRPSSPDSIASVDESRPLSPDSPVPELRSSFPDNAIPVSGYRSCSPESVCSESTEYESCFEDCFTLEERPESPDSFVSEVEDRPLSPDSIPEYRPMSPGSMNLLSDSKQSSPDSVCRSRSLSPDSPIPQYSALLCELVPVIGHRSSSLESLASDTDYDLGDFTDEASCHRSSSPDSMASANESRPLSPDSPVPEFRRAFPESSLPVSGYRPCSPEFVCSESTEYECFLGDLFTVDQRPESPDSVSKHRQMSPDSPILQYSTLFCELVPVIQHRSSSLESLASDTDYDLGVFTDEAFCHRSSSPDSMASANENRPLSPDSPVPEFRTAFPERSLPVTGYRSCSPMSVCSESTEYECFLGDLFTVEQRPVSPDSVGSLNQSRSLSPDSPIPEFRSSFPENTLTFSGYESCRLRPAISEKKCDLDIFGTSSPDATQSVNEHQPPSLDSPISMFERMKQDAVASLEDRQLSQSQTVITNVTPVPVKDIDLSKSENQTASETMTSHLFQEAVKMVPEYKLVYKAIPFNLRSNIYDPQYKGETYSPKTGVFEYTGCRMEVVQTCKMDKPHGIIDQDDYKVPSAALGTSQITKCSHKSLTISHEYNNQTSDERIKEKSDSLILDSDIRPESPESVTSETWGKDFVEKTSPALIVFLDKVVKQGNTPHGARDVALLHTEQCGSQTETISEPDYTNSEPPAGFQRPFSEDLNSESKPLATCHEFVLEPEQGTKNTEADSANMEVKRTSVDEVCKVLISTQEDSHGMRMAKQELEFQDKQDLEDKSDYATQLACQQTKARALQELSEKDISFRAQHIEGLTLNQGDSYSTTLLRDATDNEDSSSTVQDSSNVAILEQRLKLTASPSTSDAIESPASDPKTLPSIQERNTSLSSDLESVHHKPFKQSLEQAKTTSELYQIHTAPFQFYMQESHRTVTPNLSSSTSPILRFDYAPPDYTDVLSKSPGSVVSPTDMSPLSPVFNESFSDQAQSTDLPLSTGNEPARTIGSFQLSPGFQQVLSEFENTLAALHKTSTRTALAPSSKEVTHELEVSEQSTEPMDDIRLMGFDLKAKPLSVHADSLESDPEFFECLQTFSDISEPEIRSGELLDVPGAIYQVEEPSSLPSTPDFDCLTGTLKRKECTHEEKEDRQRPISWDSEELDLPIVLEPEDEYVGEHGEAYPYGYADEHSFAEELPPREEAQFDDDDSLGRDIAEELGLLSDSSEEEVLTTRVVRRRVIIQGDDIPEIPPQTVTEEQYTDEYGNIVVKKITRKIIRKYVSADGVEREEVMVEGGQQEAITVDEADSFSKVVKRTVVRSGGDQTEVTFSEPLPVGGAAASEFEVEPVHGRKVSKVIKTMVVQGERMEKQIGDPLLSADLPSAKDDFEKALSYVGGFEKVNLPHLVEKEMVKEDGSVVRRTCMRKTRTQKKTVAKDGQSKHTHLEQLEDTPEALRPDALQQHLHQLLQRYCTPEVTEEPELVAVAEDEGKREEKQDTNDKFSTA
ncbi:ankyrin-2b isoform X13 [Pygocentrus nattereri]|uniref:ankyrin-2b isoform X13 n=1 Tax=Pygocentrus nattereri TaxID=42514 RepID=UPI0008148119|nr:ankyrin-2b isoform X13 [Pygocentrus nattereri]